ncbi:hypothetical protein GA0061102_104144 [Rhizobium miluonense]|uniref:Uncharacterized protein n=1 Tax=Rhizobium miluonense TaxID=411945 RepID=A0A1C3WVF0_9HYPH|nr:hypothetical protein GA0061102_104144 [Rhizobium miluonense]
MKLFTAITIADPALSLRGIAMMPVSKDTPLRVVRRRAVQQNNVLSAIGQRPDVFRTRPRSLDSWLPWLDSRWALHVETFNSSSTKPYSFRTTIACSLKSPAFGLDKRTARACNPRQLATVRDREQSSAPMVGSNRAPKPN